MKNYLSKKYDVAGDILGEAERVYRKCGALVCAASRAELGQVAAAAEGSWLAAGWAYVQAQRAFAEAGEAWLKAVAAA